MTTAEMLFGTEINTTATVNLAAAVGVTPRTINNWRRDPEKIPWGKMKTIIRIRSLSGDDLIRMAKEGGRIGKGNKRSKRGS